MDREEIRQMIREEIKAALTSMANFAMVLDGYDSDHIETVALSAITKVAQATADLAQHSVECELRGPSVWSKCTCGQS